jgi:replication initiation and membrane attachment protein DnaB
MKLHENDRYLIDNTFNLLDSGSLFVLYARLWGFEAMGLYGYLLSCGKQSLVQSSQ